MSFHPLRTIVRSGSESLPLSNKSCSRKVDAAAWPERQSNGSRCWRCRNGSHANPSKVLIGLQQIIAGALNHPFCHVERSRDISSSYALFLGRRRYCSDPHPRQVFVSLQQIVACALEDLEQIIHRRNFLELLGQEPLEEIDRDVIVLFLGKIDQGIDLLGHVNFLVE